MLRAWRSWRSKARLLAPPPGAVNGFFAHTLMYPELAAGQPAQAPYDGLAAVWDDLSRRRLPDYPGFLADLARARGRPPGPVLDLACGTGTLTARLARTAPAVVGLDASGAMLADARRRLAVRPGLTGLWQVSGRSDLSWEESIRLDLRYVEGWSLGLDLWILVRTVGAVLGRRGAY